MARARPPNTVTAAVVQAASVLFDTPATVERALGLMREAAARGAKVVVFPEAFVGGYPKGADFHIYLGARTPEGRADYKRYFDAAVSVDGPEIAAMAQAAALRPEEPRYDYVRAIALNDLGRREEAVSVLRDNVARHPRHRDSLIALATIERDRANFAEAERYAQAALALNPNDRNVTALVQQLRGLRQRLPAVPR